MSISHNAHMHLEGRQAGLQHARGVGLGGGAEALEGLLLLHVVAHVPQRDAHGLWGA